MRSIIRSVFGAICLSVALTPVAVAATYDITSSLTSLGLTVQGPLSLTVQDPVGGLTVQGGPLSLVDLGGSLWQIYVVPQSSLTPVGQSGVVLDWVPLDVSQLLFSSGQTPAAGVAAPSLASTLLNSTFTLSGEFFTPSLVLTGADAFTYGFVFSSSDLLAPGSGSLVLLSDGAQVPVPGSAWLFGSALLAGFGLRRRA